MAVLVTAAGAVVVASKIPHGPADGAPAGHSVASLRLASGSKDTLDLTPELIHTLGIRTIQAQARPATSG